MCTINYMYIQEIKQTHTILYVFVLGLFYLCFIQLALKIIDKIKTFFLHLLKFAAVCILPLTVAIHKLS